MSKKALLIVTLAALVPTTSSSLLADVVYGTFFSKEMPLSGTGITITCGGNSYNGTIGERGDYRIFVNQEGQCLMRLPLSVPDTAAEVTSYNQPVRYDFELIKLPEGYRLVRR